MVLSQRGQQSPYDKNPCASRIPTGGQGSNRAGWKTPVPTRSSATDLPVAGARVQLCVTCDAYINGNYVDKMEYKLPWFVIIFHARNCCALGLSPKKMPGKSRPKKWMCWISLVVFMLDICINLLEMFNDLYVKPLNVRSNRQTYVF